jgi:hypothetical protein
LENPHRLFLFLFFELFFSSGKEEDFVTAMKKDWSFLIIGTWLRGMLTPLRFKEKFLNVVRRRREVEGGGEDGR